MTHTDDIRYQSSNENIGTQRPSLFAPPCPTNTHLNPYEATIGGQVTRTSSFSSFRRIPDFSYGDPQTGNALIQGENLTVLRQLHKQYSTRVKCVYIDPPYNNQERYRHYFDSRSHTSWLQMIVDRLAAIRPLLSHDGSIWISIDDSEIHYLKVAADRVFGRQNFVTTVIWQQRTTRENRKAFSNNHEYLLVYAANKREFHTSRNLLPGGENLLSRYKNPDADPRGPWQSISANVQAGHATASQFYELTAPNGKIHHPPKGRCWVYAQAKMTEEIEKGNVWFGRDGNGVPRLKRFLNSSKIGLTPETLWLADEVGTNDEAKKQLLKLFPNLKVFDTPKPERLIQRIIEIATKEDDLVLDAFLGSGTTAAVAHKMQRRYIGIEVGEHAITHCAARLRLVVDGDCTGISHETCWQGGGGFEFYKPHCSELHNDHQLHVAEPSPKNGLL